MIFSTWPVPIVFGTWNYLIVYFFVHIFNFRSNVKIFVIPYVIYIVFKNVIWINFISTYKRLSLLWTIYNNLNNYPATQVFNLHITTSSSKIRLKCPSKYKKLNIYPQLVDNKKLNYCFILKKSLRSPCITNDKMCTIFTC